LLIGIHAVDAALSRAPEQLSVLFIGEDSRNPRVRALEQRARQLGVRIVSEARSALDRRSDGERHQDVLAEFTPTTFTVKRSWIGCWATFPAIP
jgi:23S rRNA (guanosine2251-2'-O)-methyltransferase